MACPYITVTCKVLPPSCPGVYPSCSKLKQIEFVKGLFITNYTVLFCVGCKIKSYLIYKFLFKKIMFMRFFLKFTRFTLICEVCENVTLFKLRFTRLVFSIEKNKVRVFSFSYDKKIPTI